jgi:hypothetical protein
MSDSKYLGKYQSTNSNIKEISQKSLYHVHHFYFNSQHLRTENPASIILVAFTLPRILEPFTVPACRRGAIVAVHWIRPQKFIIFLHRGQLRCTLLLSTWSSEGWRSNWSDGPFPEVPNTSSGKLSGRLGLHSPRSQTPLFSQVPLVVRGKPTTNPPSHCTILCCSYMYYLGLSFYSFLLGCIEEDTGEFALLSR